MKKQRLTKRETEVYGYILGYISDNNYSPTLREIAERIGSVNHQSADHFIKSLEAKGYIKRTRGMHRNIDLI